MRWAQRHVENRDRYRSAKFLGRLLCVLALILLVANPALSQQSSRSGSKTLYTWEDERGVQHFTSSKQEAVAKGAEVKKADLAPIMRGELKIPATQAVSCVPHGGIDCAAGSDADGSVLCVDGFRDASPRFRFSCSAVHLEVADITVDEDQNIVTVFIRNRSQISAEQVRISLRGKEANLALVGPETIEGFGLERYEATAPEGHRASVASKSSVKVACVNCGA